MMRNKTLAYYSIRQQERNLWCIHGMTVWNPFLPVCAELSHNIQNPDLERRLDSINYKMEDCLLSQKTSLFNKALNEQNTDDIFFLPEKKSVTSWYKQSRLNKSLSFIALQFNIYCKSDMCLIIIIIFVCFGTWGNWCRSAAWENDSLRNDSALRFRFWGGIS